jgi:hypothetical protein
MARNSGSDEMEGQRATEQERAQEEEEEEGKQIAFLLEEVNDDIPLLWEEPAVLSREERQLKPFKSNHWNG